MLQMWLQAGEQRVRVPRPRPLSANVSCSHRFMIKRAQGRKRFGMKNFKKRWFRLTNHEFTYQKSKGNKKSWLLT